MLITVTSLIYKNMHMSYSMNAIYNNAGPGQNGSYQKEGLNCHARDGDDYSIARRFGLTTHTR